MGKRRGPRSVLRVYRKSILKRPAAFKPVLLDSLLPYIPRMEAGGHQFPAHEVAAIVDLMLVSTGHAVSRLSADHLRHGYVGLLYLFPVFSCRAARVGAKDAHGWVVWLSVPCETKIVNRSAGWGRFENSQA